MFIVPCLKRSAALAVLAIVLTGMTAPAFGIVFNIPKRSKVRATSPELGELTFEVAGPSTAVVSGPANQTVRFVDMYLRGEDPSLGTITMTLNTARASSGTLSPLDKKRLASFPRVHRQSFYAIIRASALGPDSLVSNTPIQMEGTIPSLTPADVKYHMVGPPVSFYKHGDARETTVLTIADVQTDVSRISKVPSRPRAAQRQPEDAIARPILKFKWHGAGNSCDTPLGICISIPMGLADHELSPSEIADGFGTADFQVEGNRLRMAFHREAALPDGTIHIDKDKLLEPALATALGYDSIKLKAGVYRVDLTKEPFGQAMVNIVKGNRPTLNTDPDVPESATFRVVNCQRYANTVGYCKGCGVACDDGTNYPMSCGADLFSDMKMGCGGTNLTLDPLFGSAELYKGRFSRFDSPVLTQSEVGIVKTFDLQGRNDSCLASQPTALTLIFPRHKPGAEPR